jgi:hypothetical protein
MKVVLALDKILVNSWPFDQNVSKKGNNKQTMVVRLPGRATHSKEHSQNMKALTVYFFFLLQLDSTCRGFAFRNRQGSKKIGGKGTTRSLVKVTRL